MAKKDHHGPTDPQAGKRQAKALELKTQRERKAADKATLNKWIDFAKEQREKREKREERVAELSKLRHAKKQILRRYG